MYDLPTSKANQKLNTKLFDSNICKRKISDF